MIEKLIDAESSSDEILFAPPDYAIEHDSTQESLNADPVANLAQKEENDISMEDADPSENESGAYIKIGLGIDAGGTYTDAVIYDLELNKTLCKAKALTTKWDFTVGIKRAMEKLDQKLFSEIELISVSTTLATNAIVENEGQTVGLLLMSPFGLEDCKSNIYRPNALIQGKLKITGKEIEPVNPDEVKSVVKQMMENDHVTAFAVSGYAGSINPQHELKVKKIIQEETGVFVSCGHELSDTLNFETRAATTTLNARIIPRLKSLILDLENTMAGYGVTAPIVVVKGDGTLMRKEMANNRPIETILSGPAASVAGARHLTGLADALVVDMGGTTTDTASLASGLVNLNEQGASVGEHRTHVYALDIRTTGLGGDSLILHENGNFLIGPKRVAPISWLGQNYPGTYTALEFLGDRLKHFIRSTESMQILTKTGEVKSLRLTSLEEQILSKLEQRPYSIDELLQNPDVEARLSLPLQRLEENFIIQRYGLTLTDIFHIKGLFEKWNTKSAKIYAGFYSFIAGIPLYEMIDHLLELGTKKLSLELLKHCLDNINTTELDNNPAWKTLIHLLLNEQHPNYEVAINFKHPVVGIGAPIGFFLPEAVRPFKTEAIIPDDADVANAIGAITSHVSIRKHLWIIPDYKGGFIVEGVSGIHRFKSLGEADGYARSALTHLLREQAEEAGTSCRTVNFKTVDKKSEFVGNRQIILKRHIYASLKGRPDLVLNRGRGNIQPG